MAININNTQNPTSFLLRNLATNNSQQNRTTKSAGESQVNENQGGTEAEKPVKSEDTLAARRAERAEREERAQLKQQEDLERLVKRREESKRNEGARRRAGLLKAIKGLQEQLLSLQELRLFNPEHAARVAAQLVKQLKDLVKAFKETGGTDNVGPVPSSAGGIGLAAAAPQVDPAVADITVSVNAQNPSVTADISNIANLTGEPFNPEQIPAEISRIIAELGSTSAPTPDNTSASNTSGENQTQTSSGTEGANTQSTESSESADPSDTSQSQNNIGETDNTQENQGQATAEDDEKNFETEIRAQISRDSKAIREAGTDANVITEFKAEAERVISILRDVINAAKESLERKAENGENNISDADTEQEIGAVEEELREVEKLLEDISAGISVDVAV